MLKVIKKDGRTVPMLCCAACRSWIDDAGYGAAVFVSLDEEGETQDVLLVHKGACHDKLEAAIRSKDLSSGWLELSRYLADALHNTGLPVDELQKMQAHDDEVGRL